jgi:hypothetical protein
MRPDLMSSVKSMQVRTLNQDICRPDLADVVIS